jgi:hypothetical protein
MIDMKRVAPLPLRTCPSKPKLLRARNGWQHPFSVAALRPTLDERPGKDPHKDPFQTSRNEQSENWTMTPCPGAPSQHKQGVSAMLLLRQEIVELLLENGEVGTAKMAELKLPEEVDTRRDQEVLAQLGVNIEYLLEERA